MLATTTLRRGLYLGVAFLAATLLTGCVYHPHGYGRRHDRKKVEIDVHHHDRYRRGGHYDWDRKSSKRYDNHRRKDDRKYDGKRDGRHDRDRDRKWNRDWDRDWRGGGYRY